MDFCRISHDVKLGENVKIHAFVNLYGCSIGDNSSIGTFVEIQKGSSAGKYCKISSHTFICEGITIKDNVFIGHNVTFVNDKYPQATNPEGILQNEDDWEVVPTIIEKGASIGSSTTILCGLTVGAGAIVGAGSIVTKDIGEGEIWAGNPAKFMRKVNRQ